MPSGFQIGRLFGIRVQVHVSLVVIFGLVVLSLGSGVFPSWHPDWSPVLVWGLAFIAAVLFFASVLVHELSHALVGRAVGAEVRSITLFLFGGVAHVEREPTSPRGEALMAGVGPLTSLAIGIVCSVAAGLLGMRAFQAGADPVDAVRQLSPVVTLLAWLGPINLLLAAFNMLPGFPLDGGRVLRAFLWKLTGDLRRATRWAAGAGQFLGWLLITSGVLMAFGVRIPVFGTGLIGGMWIALIGWFLNSAALGSYRQLVVRELLQGVPVWQLMRRQMPHPLHPEQPVREIVREHVLGTGDALFVVTEGEDVLGVVQARDVRRVPRGEWDTTPVGRLMKPLEQVTTASPGEPTSEALQRLGTAPELLVVDEGKPVGLLRRQDIGRWLDLQASEHALPPGLSREGGEAGFPT
jgi:Zn-dependent protease